VDALRYFLLREFPFGTDGNFSNERSTPHQRRPRNDLGNILSAPPQCLQKYFGGVLPVARHQRSHGRGACSMASPSGKLRGAMEKSPSERTHRGVQVISRANKYIDETAPWVRPEWKRTFRALPR
jgi:methionyl-tRNA synthetase